MKSGLKRTRTHSHTITHTHTWASTLACTHMSAYDKVSFKYLRCKWEWQMMSFPNSFSLPPLRPHLYLCLMWNLVKRNRCDCVRVCVALGVIRTFGSWHFSGAGVPNKPPNPVPPAVRPCQVAFRVSVQCFHFLYLAVFIFASERDFPIDWTHDKQQPQLLSTHTLLIVCVCVTLTYGTGWSRRPNAILTK